MKPKPTTVTHTWIQIYIRLSLFETKANNRNAHLDFYKCAEHILPDNGHHVPEQTVYVWFTQQTKRVLRLQYGTRKAIPCINLDIHTYNIHTYNIQTRFFVGRGGDCSALPCLPLFHDKIDNLITQTPEILFSLLIKEIFMTCLLRGPTSGQLTCMGGNAERSLRNCLPHSPIGGYHTVRPLRGAVAPTQGGAQRAHVGVETGCDALSWARAIGHQPRLGPCMLV